MKRLLTIGAVALSSLIAVVSIVWAGDPADRSPVPRDFRSAPPAFTKNMGQWPDSVLFRSDAGVATMWIMSSGVTYQFTRLIERPDARQSVGGSAGFAGRDPRRIDSGHDSLKTMLVNATFVGANPNPQVVTHGEMEYRTNYFLGDDPSKWRTDVPNYDAVTIRNVYDGVDVHFTYGAGGELRYQYSIAPGADVSQIGIAYAGSLETEPDATGGMIAHTKWGDVGGLLMVPADDVSSVSGEVSLLIRDEAVTNDEDGATDLRNPNAIALIYSTFLGGSGTDLGWGIDVDDSGCAYVTGATNSSVFPTENAFDSIRDVSYDIFVTKFSTAGNTLIYSTFLGGEGADYGIDIAVDSSGCAYVTGSTTSLAFPYQFACDACRKDNGWGEDVFVTKFSAAGNSLIYSNLLAGTDSELGYGIAVDRAGCTYVTGTTESYNLRTENAYDADVNGADAFVAKLSACGSQLLYCTFLGGSGSEIGWGIAVDDSGCAYVTGETSSTDFPTLDGYDADYNGGSSDAFVTKFSAAGNTLVFSTYLGGPSGNWGYGIDLDGSDCVYVIGETNSGYFPTGSSYDASYNGGSTDVFVTKFSEMGKSLIYSTFLGGSSGDRGWGIAVNGSGCAYVTGTTGSSDFPTQNAYDASYNGGYSPEDIFVTKLSPVGNALIYSTFLGGSGSELGYGIAADRSDCAYVTGITMSANFPTQNAYDYSFSVNAYDGFVTKLPGGHPCGDVNADFGVTVSDLQYLEECYLSSGPLPPILWTCDLDCDGAITIGDIISLADYVFGRADASCCAPQP